MLRIDFHSHILPYIDHGSSSLEESSRQLDIIRGGATDIVVATPHFYPHIHRAESFLEERNKGEQAFQDMKGRYGGTLEVCFGAEVLVCENIDKMNGIGNLCIKGTEILLLEMPTVEWSRGILNTVKNIINGGYTVVLAHIDRYFDEHAEELERFAEQGALFQINADFAASLFGRRSRVEAIKRYIDDGVVVAVGSDLHGAKKKAYGDFLQLGKQLGDERLNTVFERSEQFLKNRDGIFL